MVKSLNVLFINRIKTENQIPKQWQFTTLKSIYKDGRRKHSREPKRDISGEYNIKNIWKWIKHTKWKQKWEYVTYANSRKKWRSTADNLIILTSIIKSQRENKNKTYLFFTDAKIGMKDCLQIDERWKYII